MGTALLPVVHCPVCKSTLLGTAGSLGLLLGEDLLLPLTAVFLLVAVGHLAYRVHGYGPFGLGVLASALLMIGKFFLEAPALTYSGIALLFLASLWKVRLNRPCSACVPRPAGALDKRGTRKFGNKEVDHGDQAEN